MPTSPTDSDRGLAALARLIRHLGQTTADVANVPDVADVPDALVRKHLLAPLASRAGLARYRKDFIANALLAEVRERTLAQALAALSERAIPVILLKGISYAGSLYADPAERPMSDIDLLVPPAAHERAAQVLRRLGYWSAGSHRQASRMHHAVCFKRPGAAVDLHRSIMQPLRSRIDVQALWRRARPAAERNDGALRLEPVDEAVVHLAHAARHELRVPAINYIDAARLLARVPDSAVLARAREFRLGRAVGAAMAMTRALTRGAALRWPTLMLALPGTREILAFGSIARPVQLVRKISLVEGPAELVGLFVAGLHGTLAHRFGA
jgi:hypothetical protein